MTAGAFDPRLTTYFGDATLQAGFMPVPHLFLRHYAELGLTGQQAMFVLQIMATSWDLGKPPATLNDIGRRMGIARRTAQGISAELHARGLLAIYDQYDDGGAQTENAYDLRPLFARLATFAPASTPSGVQRQQRERAPAAHARQTTPAVSTTETGALPLEATGTAPWQEFASPPGRNSHPPLDRGIQPPKQIPARPLTEVKNLPKNSGRREQEQQQASAAAVHQLGWLGREEQKPGGHSQRWDLPLSAADVRKSRQLLARIGLNANVADVVAPTLHPAEVWALWLHARSSRLGLAWIAGQVYDRRAQRPRLAGIPIPLEESGRLLDALPVDAAVALLDIIDRYAPDERGAAQSALAGALHGHDLAAMEAAVDAIWPVIAGAQTSHARHIPQSDTSAQAGPLPVAEDPRWSAAKATLQAVLSETEYTTWIAPLSLLHAEETLIVIAAPNCFVRSELQSTHANVVQDAVETAWGKTMAVEVIIDIAVLT